MKRWLTLILLVAACLALGAAATALAEGKGRFVLDRLSAFRAPPPPRGDRDAPPPPPDAKNRAGDHLAQAYDTLTLAGLCERGEGRQADKETSRLLDSSREFYRTAHKAYQDGDYERAAEAALAANDSARGVLYTLQANAGKQADLPLPPVVGHVGPPPPPRGDRRPPPPRGDRDAPPPSRGDRPPPPPRGDRDAPPPPRGDRDAPPPPRGDRDTPPPARGDRQPPPPPPGGPAAAREPEAAATDAIQRADDRVNAAPAGVKGPGRAFSEAARKSLDQAKRAQKDGDFFKAVDQARAAEAWSHVEEHLQRADGAAGDRPAPREDRRERPREELKRQPPMPPSTD
jgi:hypothetical protein